KRGETAHFEIDVARRERIRKNHSVTHLLHWALREVLGAHAQQKGSLVGPDRLRFDFTHNSGPDPEQVGRGEDLGNELILANTPAQTEVLRREVRWRAAQIGLVTLRRAVRRTPCASHWRHWTFQDRGGAGYRGRSQK